MLLLTAILLRFVALGEIPPGLYRDEAFNGLDALAVLDGQHQLFFTDNNGREPAYIYLTALAITAFGQTVFSLRLTAAVVGVLTTWCTYQLAANWLGRRVGFLAAWLWAITFWPVHLSRVGFRPVLLAPCLALTFWVGTRAYQTQQNYLWFLSGVLYGLSYYTYLAVRFTPILLVLLGVYLLGCHGWRLRRTLWLGAIWFGLGTAVSLAPLLFLFWQQPDLILGRTGQVSILNAAINGGDLWGTLWENVGQALGMFIGQGDIILRHNFPNRPVFEIFMALPFLIGVAWCLRHWRRPAAMTILLWTIVMLGPTILAEDTPHFLRASGVLPAVLLLPAIGLDVLWGWSQLPVYGRRGLVIVLIAGSVWLTIRDYQAYGRNPDVAYLFETAVRDLANDMNNQPMDMTILSDERFWSAWPTLAYLVGPERVTQFQPDATPPPLFTSDAAIYIWPYGSLAVVPQLIHPPAQVSVLVGSLARGDLEETAYPLYLRYIAQSDTIVHPIQANFADRFQLHQTAVTPLAENQLQVDLYWSTTTAVEQTVIAFVHVLGEHGSIGQDDAPPAAGYWLPAWWQPGLVVQDRHLITLSEPYDAKHHQLIIGLYDAQTGDRFPLLDAIGQPIGDTWELK